MALDDLEIVVDIIDSFSDEIDELLADLESVDIQSGRVEDIYIDVDTLGTQDLTELQTQLSTLTNETVTVTADTINEQEILELHSQLQSLSDEEIDVWVESIGEEEIAELQSQLSSLTDETVNLDVNNFGTDEIASLKSQIATLRDKIVQVDVGTSGEEKLLSLAALKRVAAEDREADVDIDVDGLAKLTAANNQLALFNALQAGDKNIGVGGGMPGWGGPARGDKDDNPLAISMSSLHNVLATLIPMLLVYVGALPAAIGGVVALGAAAVSAAAALAALGGLSFYGLALIEGDGDAMAGLSDIAEEIQSDFTDAFAPLARDLAPLAEDAVAGLGEMFRVLASHGDILTGLTDEARDFGQFMQEYIVGTAVAMGQFTEAAAPLFGVIASALADADVLQSLSTFLADVLPALTMFSSILVAVFKNLVGMSEGFLLVATIMTHFINLLFNIVTGFGLFEDGAGVVIGSLLALLTVSSLLYKLYTAQFIEALLDAAGGLYTQASAAYATAQSEGVLAAMTSILSKQMLALYAKIALVTGGLYILASLAGNFLASSFATGRSEIEKATDSLREFQDVQSDLDGMGGASSNVYSFNPTTRQTQINASNVQDASRVAKREKFRSDDYSISQ